MGACTDPTCTDQGGTDLLDAIGFATDPFGYLFKQTQQAAVGLGNAVLDVWGSATLPDLTADWFLRAYAMTFALSLFLLVLLLLPQLVRTARGTQSPGELGETFFGYVPLFLIGAIFGPVAGVAIVKIIAALTESLVFALFKTTTTGVIEHLLLTILSANPNTIIGGVIVAEILMVAMVLALLAALMVFIVQLVTLYLTGVLMPLATVGIVDPRLRASSTGLLRVWMGVLAAHPLLILMLGVAFAFTIDGQLKFDQTGTVNLIALIAAVIAIGIAVFLPTRLMKLAGSQLPGVSSAQSQPPPPIGASSLHQLARSAPSGGSPTAANGGRLMEIAAQREAAMGISQGAAAAKGGSVAGTAVGATARGAAAGTSAAAGSGAAAAGGGAAATAGAAAGAGAATAGVGAVVIGAAALAGSAKRSTEALGDAVVAPVTETP